jgi:hypothetical protein
MLLHLYPTDDHPEGSNERPWFILIADLIFPSEYHPSGIQGFPWFEREGNLVYPAYGHPECRDGSGPHFLIRGEHFHHAETDLAWFRTEPVRGLSAERERLQGLATKLETMRHRRR